MILHTLNASPTSNAFSDCIHVAGPGDALLLMGDGIYAAITDTPAWEQLAALELEIYALAMDVAAAGISTSDPCELIDMDEFVALTERFKRQMAWY